MRISQDIRDAMAEKSLEFAEQGNRVYLPLTS
jgi:phosphomethylpyrimidine synthase